MNIKSMLLAGGDFAKENAPQLLAAAGIIGFFTAIGFAIKAAPKAELKLEQAIREKAVETDTPEEDVKLTPVETVKAVGPTLAPTVAMAAASTAAIIASNYISGKRVTAVAAAYSLGEKALESFQKKAIEVVGEKKVEEIEKAVAKEQMDNSNVTPRMVVVNNGEILYYDPKIDRLFSCTKERMANAVAKMNQQLIEEQFVSLNDLYCELGQSTVDIGDDLGWCIDDPGPVEIKYTSMITDDGRPCLVMKYSITTKYYHHNIHI